MNSTHTHTYERRALPCKVISLLQDKACFQNSSHGVKETQSKCKTPPAIFGYIHIAHLCLLVLADTKHSSVTASWSELWIMVSNVPKGFFLFYTGQRKIIGCRSQEKTYKHVGTYAELTCKWNRNLEIHKKSERTSILAYQAPAPTSTLTLSTGGEVKTCLWHK